MEHKQAFSLRLPAIGLATICLLAVLTGCTAAAFGKPSLALQVQSAVSSGNVNVHVVDGTAFLTGRVSSTYDSLAAQRAAARYEGIDKVDNRIFVVF